MAGNGGLEAPLLLSSEPPSEEPHPSSSSSPPPRILDREGRFFQSRGRWSVVNTDRGMRNRRGDGGLQPTSAAPNTFRRTPPKRSNAKPRNRLCCLPSSDSAPRSCWDDWFHTISYTPTALLLLVVFAAYFATVVAFAGLYYSVNKLGVRYGHSSEGGEGAINAGGEGGESENPPVMSLVGAEEGVDSFCGMDINNYMEALYFSLSTMATIGYGTSDYYFGSCWAPFLLVLLQVFAALVFSSVAIGLIFQRMSRGQKRGRTIVFSDVSVLRKVRGQWYWMFRVAELRKRHIIGAKVRVFCVRHERCPIGEKAGGDKDGTQRVVELETAHFVSHPLSILGGGGNSAPSEASSSLSSSIMGESSPGSGSAYEQSILMGLPHVCVHRMDVASPMMPPRPVWYDEKGLPHGSAVSKEGSSLSMIEEGSVPSQEDVASFLLDRQAEIIAFLEGTCEVTGMTLQARHSYRIEDIAFNHTFAPCVFPAPSDSSSKGKWWKPISKAKVDDITEHESLVSSEEDVGYNIQSPALEVDFGQFHDVMPAPLDCMSCPYVPSTAGRGSR